MKLIWFNFYKNFYSDKESLINFYDLLYFTLFVYYHENKLFDNLSKKAEQEIRDAEKRFYISIEKKLQNNDTSNILLKKVDF